MIRIICDRCGKDLTDTDRRGYLLLSVRDKEDREATREFEDCHYCISCIHDIHEFIKESRMLSDEDQVRQEDDSPEDERKVYDNKKADRKRVDIGKIMALRNAGWSNKKIAEEMGMTPSAVATQICLYKKKLALPGG